MAKRPLAVPTAQISRADFMRLQAKLDKRLAREGFVDIECGADLNLRPATTFRHTSATGGHGAEVVIGGVEIIPAIRPGSPGDSGSRRNMSCLELVESVFDSPRARAWMIFSQAAHELPTDARTRKILLSVAENGSLTEAMRRHRTTYDTVRLLVIGLCDAIGVEYRSLFSAVTEVAPTPDLPKPGPVRQLRQDEIRRIYREPERAAG
jgi:hypothetical protein